MADTSKTGDEIAAFYGLGLERDRLSGGSGKLEFLRTQTLLKRYLPSPPAIVADIGGGPGRYAFWLAECGYRVHLLDPIPLHIEQANSEISRRTDVTLASAGIGDARQLPFPDETVDVVLLLGPLYHLPERADRRQALAEASRVCRRGGLVIAATISRFASTLDGLRGRHLEDVVFAAVAEDDRRNGQHRNSTGNPAYFTTAYFHRPQELASECSSLGLIHNATVAVEGPAWLLPDLDARLSEERPRRVLLDAIAALEAEPSLLGASAHLLTVAQRP